MPTFLALPWRSYAEESHPRVKIHWMLDTVEVALRWAVAVALAEVRAAESGVVNDRLLADLRQHIARPTLGRWVAMLRALTEARPERPVLADGIFDLYASVIGEAFSNRSTGGSEESSLLVLRNLMAHSGGLSRERSAELLANHEPRFCELVRQVCACTDGVEIHAAYDGRVVLLKGLTPTPISGPSPIELTGEEQVWLVRGHVCLPLFPLAVYGPVRVADAAGALEARGSGAAPQMYARAEDRSLSYTPLGRDEGHAERPEIDKLREMFGFDVATRKARQESEGGYRWDDTLREANELADELIGRAEDIKRIKSWLKTREPREETTPQLGWISGGPGIGKSMLMARVASDLAAGMAHHGVYFHRFRAGDGRNSRRSFLQLLRQALCSWQPLEAVTDQPAEDVLSDKDLVEDVKLRLEAVAKLEAHDPRAKPPTFRVIIDGLDEIAAIDAGIAALIDDLAVAGTVWLAAGRPEHGLQEAFTSEKCEAVYGPSGLPGMSPTDIRAMLVEGLGTGRYSLLARDEESADGEISNAFIAAVVERASGLPIYVKLVLDDLRTGSLAPTDEKRLPSGLTAYYDALVERMGVSDLRADLTFLVCLFASSREPLDELSISMLLSDGAREGGPIEPEGADYVATLLRAGRALFRQAQTPSGSVGYILYHQSFREYVTEAGVLARTLERSQRMLGRLADRWRELPEGSLRNHLFRWGTQYALSWLGQDGADAAVRRLTDFAYLQARTAELPPSEASDLAREFDGLLRAGQGREALSVWESFFRERAHLLRRGSDDWPANRILLQLAVEHADDSPVTRTAETWLAEGHCDWMWLRQAWRPSASAEGLLQTVLEGHTDKILGAREIQNGRIASWAKDNTLRIWSIQTGDCVQTLNLGPPSRDWQTWYDGGEFVSDSRLVCWIDSLLSVWDLSNGDLVRELKGHEKKVRGINAVDDERFLSWDDTTVRLWDMTTGECLHLLNHEPFAGSHLDSIHGAIAIGNKVYTQFSIYLCIWDVLTCELQSKCYGRVFENGLLGSELEDGRFQIIEPTTKAEVTILDDGRRVPIDGTIVLEDGRQFWASAVPLVLSDGRLLKPKPPNTVEIFDPAHDDALSLTLDRTGQVLGSIEISEDRVLLWSEGNSMTIWNVKATTGNERRVTPQLDDAVTGCIVPDPNGVLVWNDGGPFRIVDPATGEVRLALEGISGGVRGAIVLNDSRILSWGGETGDFGEFADLNVGMRIWNPDSGQFVEQFDGNERGIEIVRKLKDHRLFTWSGFDRMRIWNLESGECEAAFERKYESSDEGEEPDELGELEELEALSDALDSDDWADDDEVQKPFIQGAGVVGEDKVMSWYSDGEIIVWDLSGAEISTIRIPDDPYRLQPVLSTFDHNIVVTFESGVQIWALDSGECIKKKETVDDDIVGVLPVSLAELAIWSSTSMHLWNWASDSLAELAGGDGFSIEGAILSPSGSHIMWWGFLGAGQTKYLRSCEIENRHLSREWRLNALANESPPAFRELVAATESAGDQCLTPVSGAVTQYPVIGRSTDGWAAAGDSTGVVLAGASEVAHWSAHPDTDVCAIHPSGFIVVKHLNEVSILHAYRGNSRISFNVEPHDSEQWD